MAHIRKRARHSGIDESFWDTLDNAAKLMPAITSTRSPNVYRLSAVLHDEVVPEALQKALEKAIAIMPAFALKLHRGLFWYYFDVNTEHPVVRQEKKYPCAPIYRANEKGFLFRVTYFHKRINLEMYHALTDGLGAVSFMRLLVCCYFNVLFPEEVPEEYIRSEADEVSRDFGEDSFIRNVSDAPEDSTATKREVDAYRLGGYRYDGARLGVLSAVIPTDALLELARSHGATVSQYLTSLLIWSISNTSYRRTGRNKPIVVSIPVNLRGMFDSHTLRNFFGHMNVGASPSREATFEDVLAEVKKGFERGLTKGAFEREITNHVNIERIPGIKFVPRIIKDMVMRIIFSHNAKKYTLTFSNLGKITLPSMISERVERFDVIIGGSESHVKKASLCSYNNSTVLTFSSTVDDNSLEQYMLSHLAAEGLDITVCSNETPEPKKVKREKPAKQKSEKQTREKAPKPKKEKVKKQKEKNGGEEGSV